MVQVSEGGMSSSKVSAIVCRKARIRHSYRSCTCGELSVAECTPYVHYTTYIAYLLVENLEILQLS